MTISTHMPLVGVAGSPRAVAIDSREAVESSGSTVIAVGPRYFETLQIPIVLGRSLDVSDEGAAQAGAVVDQRFAALFFPDQSPLGRRIQLTTTAGQSASTPWLTIVGIAPQLRVLVDAMSSRDPVTLSLVSGLLAIVAVIATLLPARRAARVDPAQTLRAE